MNLRTVAVIASAACSVLLGAHAHGSAARSLPDVAVSQLPAEAQSTLVLIRHGGPFPYSRDGVAFGNRERLLPPRPRGYYHEYTVKTPGASTRGARRIICGGELESIDECYYTGDHYQSFRRIRR